MGILITINYKHIAYRGIETLKADIFSAQTSNTPQTITINSRLIDTPLFYRSNEYLHRAHIRVMDYIGNLASRFSSPIDINDQLQVDLDITTLSYFEVLRALQSNVNGNGVDTERLKLQKLSDTHYLIIEKTDIAPEELGKQLREYQLNLQLEIAGKLSSRWRQAFEKAEALVKWRLLGQDVGTLVGVPLATYMVGKGLNTFFQFLIQITHIIDRIPDSTLQTLMAFALAFGLSILVIKNCTLALQNWMTSKLGNVSELRLRYARNIGIGKRINDVEKWASRNKTFVELCIRHIMLKINNVHELNVRKYGFLEIAIKVTGQWLRQNRLNNKLDSRTAKIIEVIGGYLTHGENRIRVAAMGALAKEAGVEAIKYKVTIEAILKTPAVERTFPDYTLDGIDDIANTENPDDMLRTAAVRALSTLGDLASLELVYKELCYYLDKPRGTYADVHAMYALKTIAMILERHYHIPAEHGELRFSLKELATNRDGKYREDIQAYALRALSRLPFPVEGKSVSSDLLASICPEYQEQSWFTLLFKIKASNDEGIREYSFITNANDELNRIDGENRELAERLRQCWRDVHAQDQKMEIHKLFTSIISDSPRSSLLTLEALGGLVFWVTHQDTITPKALAQYLSSLYQQSSVEIRKYIQTIMREVLHSPRVDQLTSTNLSGTSKFCNSGIEIRYVDSMTHAKQELSAIRRGGDLGIFVTDAWYTRDELKAVAEDQEMPLMEPMEAALDIKRFVNNCRRYLSGLPVEVPIWDIVRGKPVSNRIQYLPERGKLVILCPTGYRQFIEEPLQKLAKKIDTTVIVNNERLNENGASVPVETW